MKCNLIAESIIKGFVSVLVLSLITMSKKTLKRCLYSDMFMPGGSGIDLDNVVFGKRRRTALPDNHPDERPSRSTGLVTLSEYSFAPLKAHLNASNEVNSTSGGGDEPKTSQPNKPQIKSQFSFWLKSQEDNLHNKPLQEKVSYENSLSNELLQENVLFDMLPEILYEDSTFNERLLELLREDDSLKEKTLSERLSEISQKASSLNKQLPEMLIPDTLIKDTINLIGPFNFKQRVDKIPFPNFFYTKAIPPPVITIF